MLYRRLTWRFWAAIGTLAVLYAILGFPLGHDGTVEEWVYRIGLTAASAAVLVFVGVYTVLGLRSDLPSAKWWRTTMGSIVVAGAFSLLPTTAPLAWTFWVDNGILTPSWLAWAEVSGPALSGLVWLLASAFWIKASAADTTVRQADPQDGSGA